MENKKIKLIIGIVVLMLLTFGATYAFYEWVSNDNTNITFDVDGLKVRYEGGANITGVSLVPTDTKEEGILKTIDVELDSDQVITPTPSLSLYLDLTAFPSALSDA